MSYNDFERSVSDSQPIELYHFFDGNEQHWRYTSNSEPISFLDQTYTPDAIHRESIVLMENHFKNEFQVTLGLNNAFALDYIHGLLESKISLEVYRLQDTHYIIAWSGVVQRITFDDRGIPTIKASPISTEITRAGARRRCQIMCDLPLYSPYCSVNRLLYLVEGTILSSSGITLTSDEFASKPDNWLRGGLITVGYAKRLIQWHQGNQVKITRQIQGVVPGSTFSAYAGCGHTPSDCLNKFNNMIHYGGAQFLPVENPFISPVSY